MKKIFFLCLSLVATLSAVADVRICDVSCDANGHFNTPFIKSGSITWDRESHTLTLDNAVVEHYTDNIYDNIRPIRISESEATIVIHGQCKLTTNGFSVMALDTYNAKNVTIQGDGNLQISSTWIDIFLIDTNLTIKDISLESQSGIANNGNGVNVALAFNNVQANIKGLVERIGEGITFTNCAITYPADAYISEVEGYGYAIYCGNDDIPDHIVISRTSNVKGDVNGDGEVNIADINAVIAVILGGGGSNTSGDVNADGEINIADVNAIINIILNPVVIEDHEWVDLGLPSGTLWATMNVGAKVPEEYGDYFAWGETAPKQVYSWSTYKWCNGSQNTITKYCTNSDYGMVDNKTQLVLGDDAAYVNWGALWRMPTKEQEKELIDKCTWTETTQNGVYGLLVTGPNGNTIFLPATGGRFDDGLNLTGSHGGYWSRTLYEYESNKSCGLFFGSGRLDWESYRDNGFTVRAVRVSQN
jgi:hypothetical protein